MKIVPRPIFRAVIAFVWAAALAGCSPVDIVNALTPTGTYTVTGDSAYGEDPRNRLDIYRPLPADNAQPPAGYPVVVFFHGGTWNSGERGDYRFVGEALASRGIVTMVADYRLYPQVRYPDFLVDCAQAVAWARRQAKTYGGDPLRLFVMGHSSGAYNAAMIALDARWLSTVKLSPAVLAGWIGLAGPYDFFPTQNVGAQPVFNHPDYPVGAQPIEHVSAMAPRAFLGAPDIDDVVSPTRSTRQLAEKLRAAGVPVQLDFYPRTNHYTIVGALARPLHLLAPVLDDVVAFVRDAPAR